ncbi:hypothetical protein [Priestia megaterium]|uniref:hypothetical protein n=1 Tax=Priestia megaterium TaxID=1404 RepID=UPI002795F3DE|nr:hypothetical protein [Priestia megaterium]
MEITQKEIAETMLANLSGGELQRLAEEFLTREYKWSKLSHYGAVEGGARTRKGIPDIWLQTETDIIYISATGDKSKGKLYEDVEKSVNEFSGADATKKHKCIAFLNYDPNPQEATDCFDLCNLNNVEFSYYTNNFISESLNSKYQDLRKKYLGMKLDNDVWSLVLNNSEDNDLKKIDVFVSGAEWLDSDEKDNTVMVIKELLMNAMEYGNSTEFKIFLYDKALVVVDGGEEFNLLKFEGKPTSGHGGGKMTVDWYIKNIKGIDLIYKWKKSTEENFYSFRKKKRIEDGIIEFNGDCQYELRYRISEYKELIVPDKCNELIFKIPRHLVIMSLGLRLVEFLHQLIDDERYKMYNFKIAVHNFHHRMIMEYFEAYAAEYDRISLIFYKD